MQHLLRPLALSGLFAAATLLAQPVVAQHTLRFTTADNDEVIFPTTQLNSGSFTYEAWVKYSAPQVLNSFTTLFEYGNDNRAVYLGTDGLLSIYGGTSSVVTTVPLPVMSWHHIAFTYDDNTTESTFYLDGVVAGTGLTSFPNTTETELGIGHYSGDAGWQGEIDEVLVWSSVRTAAQIHADKGGLVAGTEPSLVGYFKFDEGTGQTLTNQKVGGGGAVLGLTNAIEQQDPQWTTNNAPLATPAEVGAAHFGLSISPNPTNQHQANQVRLRYTLPTAAVVSLTLLDALGRTVSTTATAEQLGGDHVAELPVGGLSPGVYTCRLCAGTTVAVRRLVVE